MYLTRLIGILFKPHKKGQVSRWSTLATSPMLILLAIVSLTATMGQRYYNQPELKQGTIAPETIRVPQDDTVIDHKLTDERRKSARLGDITVVMIDQSANQRVDEELAEVLRLGNQARDVVANFPFVNTGILSTITQRHLRQVSQEKWQAIPKIVEEQLQERPPGPESEGTVSTSSTQNKVRVKSEDNNTIQQTSPEDKLSEGKSIPKGYQKNSSIVINSCLLYTSDAADDL